MHCCAGEREREVGVGESSRGVLEGRGERERGRGGREL